MSSQSPFIKTRKPGERIFCLLMVMGSVYLFWQSYAISGFSSFSSPGAFPLAASATMVLASCVTFLNTLKLPAAENVRFVYHCFPPIVAVIMALILIYSVVLESLGFVLFQLCLSVRFYPVFISTQRPHYTHNKLAGPNCRVHYFSLNFPSRAS